jgi:large subunit ribosomal protein L24
MKIKLNDTVLVKCGKDKGKKGKVLRVNKKKKQIVVEKINMRTKHIKKSAQKAGEKISYEAPINISNAMIICPSCTKTTRVKYLKPAKGYKQRICKECGQSLDQMVERKAKSKKEI